MKHRYALALAALLPLVAWTQTNPVPKVAEPAAKVAAAPVSATDPRVALAAKLPGAKPEDLRATPVAGIYELTHGADISYVSADAKYVFAGDMYRIASSGDFPNLSEVRRRELRLQKLGEVPESQMVVFGPANSAHTISVFTDVDCPWCQRLHSQIAEYNRLGIRVRYLFYPRSGPKTESWAKAEAVWCATDRNDALTRSKRGEKLPLSVCPNSPVAREYKLGRDIGVSGTPGVVLENGELIPGYISPSQMLVHIKQSALADAVPRSN